MKKRLKKTGKALLYILFLAAFTTVLLEVAYRSQWVDFYAAEWKGLNSAGLRKSVKPNILVAGDSFTADDSGYVRLLRDSLPQYDVLNAAVPGTGIFQINYLLKRRVRQARPDIFIYQVYVGNDLFDIRHPRSSKMGFVRNTYWWLADRVRILSYINFRLAGMRYRYYDDAGGAYKPKLVQEFSPADYSRREKLNFAAEPSLIENTLYLKMGRGGDMLRWENQLHRMNRLLPADCRKYILLIPHCSQVSMDYRRHMEQVGALFTQEVNMPETYPLYDEIRAMAHNLGFTVIDPLNEMRQAESTGYRLYYPNDPHLSRSGQWVVGEAILRQFKSDAAR